jgi:ubiquinone/menaquinone biosynthesis C-methylase UbiE
MAREAQPLMEQHGTSLENQYRLRFSESEHYRNQVWKVICSEFFSKYIAVNSKILDIGSGWGEFINNVVAAEKYAIDLNPDAKHRLSPAIVFMNQDCSKPWDVASESLDVVFTSNFLEHLPDKQSIERTLAEAYRCLKKDGRIICMGPNIKYVSGKYWDFYDHHLPLTEASVAEVLRLCGFRIESCVPRFLPYSMSTGKKTPLFLIKMYLHLSLAWPIWGQQFLVTGRKGA